MSRSTLYRSIPLASKHGCFAAGVFPFQVVDDFCILFKSTHWLQQWPFSAWNWCFHEPLWVQTIVIHSMITDHIRQHNPIFSQFSTTRWALQKPIPCERLSLIHVAWFKAYLTIAATSCRKHRDWRVRNSLRGGFPWRLIRYSLFSARKKILSTSSTLKTHINTTTGFPFVDFWRHQAVPIMQAFLAPQRVLKLWIPSCRSACTYK